MRLNFWWLWMPAVILAVPVALLVMMGRFDGLYGQDPFAYYEYAMGPARASLLNLTALLPFFWPPGYPLLVAMLSLVTGPVTAAAQAVSLLMGAAAVLFTTLLAREAWLDLGRPSGVGDVLVPLAAGLLAACQPQLWQSSAVVMADTTGLAMAALGAWALLRFGREGRAKWLVLASAALAWALLTRWIYGLLAILSGVHAIATLLRRQRAGATTRAAVLQGGGAALAALLILAPVMVPAVRGLQQPAQGAAPFAGSWEVYSWSPLNAFRREFVTTDGRLSYRLPNGLYYALAPGHRYYFTPLGALFLLPGLWVAIRSRRPALLLLAAWAAAVYAFHAGAAWQNFRFTLAYLPSLAVLAAVGFGHVVEVSPARWRWAIGVLLALTLAAMVAGGIQLTRGFITRKDADLRMARQVEALVPPTARLLSFGPSLLLRHYTALEITELYYTPSGDVPALAREARPVYLILDVANLETQWREEDVSAGYRWLRDGPGLERVAELGSLTLFRVRQ